MTRKASIGVLLAATVALGAEPTRSKPAVSVAYFEVQHPDPAMQVFKKAIAQMLITDLIANPAITVVERDRLEDVMAELKLQTTAAFDQATTSKLGHMLGGKYLVTGNILTTPRGEVLFDVRVINNALAANVGGGRVKGTADDVFDAEQKLVGMVNAAIAKAESAEPPPPPPKRGTKLSVKTGVKYAEALDLLDKKDKAGAKTKLQEVVKEQPDFLLASLDLDKLVK